MTAEEAVARPGRLGGDLAPQRLCDMCVWHRPGSMEVVLLETESWKATVEPRYGGKLSSLVYKPTGSELLFKNPVFQPGALGRLNAWTSGGFTQFILDTAYLILNT